MAKRKQSGPKRIRTKQGYRYVDAKGRRVSHDEYKAAKALTAQARAESSKKRGAVTYWKNRRKTIFSNLGENVPRRKGKQTQNRLKVWSDIIESGGIPTPDSVSSVASTHYDGESIVRRYWRFEGIEAEQTVKDLLLNLDDDEDFHGLAQVTLGTGFGKDAEWVGTPVALPIDVKRRLDVWQHRASVQRIFELAEEGQTVWWEVYTDELVKDKPSKPNKRGKKHGKSKKLGPSKRSKQRSSNKSSRKAPKRRTDNRRRKASNRKTAKRGSGKNLRGKRQSPRKGKGRRR